MIAKIRSIFGNKRKNGRLILALPIIFLWAGCPGQDTPAPAADRVDLNPLCQKIALRTPVEVSVNRADINENEVIRIHRFTFEGIKEPFNPSVIKLNSGFLMTARFDCRTATSSDHQSYNLVYELDDSLNIKGPARVLDVPRPLQFQTHDVRYSSQTQDLRLFEHGGEIFITYNDVDDGHTFTLWNTRKMFVARLNLKDGTWVAENPVLVKSPVVREGLDQREKNWVPFESKDRELMFGYFIDPHVVLNFGNVIDPLNSAEIKPTMLGQKINGTKIAPKELGELRGGTPAIYLGDRNEYLSFFHSVTKNKNPVSTVYGLGAYTFSANDYAISGFSASAIKYSGMYETERSFWVKELRGSVIFPAGLAQANVQGKEVFLVAAGINDTTANLIEIDREKLFENIKPVATKS